MSLFCCDLSFVGSCAADQLGFVHLPLMNNFNKTEAAVFPMLLEETTFQGSTVPV